MGSPTRRPVLMQTGRSRLLGVVDLDVVVTEADVVEQSGIHDEIGRLNSMPPGSSMASRQSSRPRSKSGAFQTFGHRCRTVDR